MPTINRQKFIEFLAKNESAAKFFIDHISHYSNVLDMSFIEQHGDQLSWEYLSGNKSLPWSEAFIERYADKWDWDALSVNKSLPWNEALIERYADKWEWGEYYGGLSSNKSLPWTETLIERFANVANKWYLRTVS